MVMPTLWLLPYMTIPAIIDFRNHGYFPGRPVAIPIILCLSLLATVGFYTIARLIKHDGIRKWFFIAFYFVTAFPILLFVVPSVISLLLSGLATDHAHYYEQAIFLAIYSPLVLSFTMSPVIFAHIAYALSVKKLLESDSEEEGEEGSPNR